MNRPWLSVVLPTYNGSAFLPKALASIHAQADRNIEVIAVDDGSTDDTLSLLRKFAQHFPLRIIERDHAGNWVANTNFGLRLAQGEWVCFLHQDDAWLPSRLARLQCAIREGPKCRFWLHACRFIDIKGRSLGSWTCPLSSDRAGMEPTTVLGRLLVQNWIGIPAPLFRREDALAVGGLDEALWYTADWDFWLKLAVLGRTGYLPRALACFRIHPASQTIQRGRERGAVEGQCRRVQERHFPLWPTSHRVRERVRKVANLATTVNGCMADRLGGAPIPWLSLLRRFAQLGPEGSWQFWRDSRLLERLLARLKTKIKN